MKILAVDSCCRRVGAALLDGDDLLREQVLPVGVSASRGLLALIDRLLREVGWSVSELDLFSLTKGPGSFTSLRVGVSIIKGLAWVCDKPVAAVNTLDALAQAARGVDGLVCPLLNAHQGQLYAAFYRRRGAVMVKESQDLLLDPCALAERVRERVYLLGGGVEPYEKQLREALGDAAVFATPSVDCPGAALVGRLGRRCLEAGDALCARQLTPYYLRRPAAEVAWRCSPQPSP